MVYGTHPKLELPLCTLQIVYLNQGVAQSIGGYRTIAALRGSVSAPGDSSTMFADVWLKAPPYTRQPLMRASVPRFVDYTSSASMISAANAALADGMMVIEQRASVRTCVRICCVCAEHGDLCLSYRIVYIAGVHRAGVYSAESYMGGCCVNGCINTARSLRRRKFCSTPEGAG